MQKRFRKTQLGGSAEVWVDVGRLRYRVELYENGEYVNRTRGWRGSEEVKAFVLGKDFSALVHIDPSGKSWCTWPR